MMIRLGTFYHVFLSDDGTKMESDKIDDFYRDMVRYVNENQVNSSTSYLLTTDLKHKQTYIFTKKGDSWEKLYQWSCTNQNLRHQLLQNLLYRREKTLFWN